MRKQQRREASKASNREETFRDDDDRLTKIHSPFHFIKVQKTCQFAMVLFCFHSSFHLTSIFLSFEIVDFCSEKSSNQIGIENQRVISVNIS